MKLLHLCYLFCLLDTIYGRKSFLQLIPNSDNVVYDGRYWPGVGHKWRGGGGPLNQFGLDFEHSGFNWDHQLCMKDSDGDGRTNGEELGDPECRWTVGSTPARTTGITHPGKADVPPAPGSTSASPAPQKIADADDEDGDDDDDAERGEKQGHGEPHEGEKPDLSPRDGPSRGRPGLATSAIGAYPGWTGALHVHGHLMINASADGVHIHGVLAGLEPNATGGWHVHMGIACSDADEVRGHFVRDDGADPWAPVKYESSGLGTAEVNLNFGAFQFHELLGHAVVIHAANGSRVGCGLIETSDASVAVGAYPGYSGALVPKGVVTVQELDKGIHLSGVVVGLENRVNGGWHIHEGTTCADAGGHLFHASATDADDPWKQVKYASSDSGVARLLLSFDDLEFHDVLGRALVVHAANGDKIACGLIRQGTRRGGCRARGCPKIYSPICGSDAKTYANDCLFARAQCRDPTLTLVKYEACFTQGCQPRACPKNYQPLCGTDGMTYPNECALQNAACQYKSLKVNHEGECTENSEKHRPPMPNSGDIVVVIIVAAVLALGVGGVVVYKVHLKKSRGYQDTMGGMDVVPDAVTGVPAKDLPQP